MVPGKVVQNLNRLRPKSLAAGRPSRPKQETASKENTTSIPIPGTPFRLTAEGRLHVAVDLQELLTNQGIPDQLASRLIAQKDPEAVAKVLLNALYLQSQGKLQNGPGYIRAGIEDGYELCLKLPADSKSGDASWKINFKSSRPNSSKRLKLASKPMNKPRLPMFLSASTPENLIAYLRRHFLCFRSRSSNATPRSLTPLSESKSMSSLVANPEGFNRFKNQVVLAYSNHSVVESPPNVSFCARSGDLELAQVSDPPAGRYGLAEAGMLLPSDN